MLDPELTAWLSETAWAQEPTEEARRDQAAHRPDDAEKLLVMQGERRTLRRKLAATPA